MRSLSGGNQQKVVLSKWLAAEPRILILDEPTHGVDVGTKADVHRTISHLAAQGLTILMISSELPEILGMSDRVLVMREGRLVAELPRAEATQERVIAAAAGVGGGSMSAVASDGARRRTSSPASSFRLRELGIFVALGVAIVFFAVRAPNFLTVGNWQDIAQGRRDGRRRRGRRDDGRADAQHRPQRRLDRRRSARTVAADYARAPPRRAARR